MLIHLADEQETFINFRETAPLKADRQMYQDEKGRLIDDLSTSGYLAVGVPGTVKGLNYALEKYGTLERERVIYPAIALAEDGYILQQGDINIFKAGRKKLLEPNVADIFLQKERPYEVGDLLVQKDLAHTLTKIARQPDAFIAVILPKRLSLQVKQTTVFLASKTLPSTR